ncbi:MAG: valine--pyruvate transaminase [Xanthomonadales bacterium]|nr:valine--pyruvate transaminase [Xanthomonadales bacterium]MDH3940221.1 valine--pyruvate transaminase [Xanthomonadales bacterium]MDH4002071.1 valine--pyruvate transaminase [Xanthomonadales bacterium]
MKLSVFGKKFARNSGIVNLMDDLGTALLLNPEMIMMGGGNPGRIPEAEALFRESLEGFLVDDRARHELLGQYQSPAGDLGFRKEMAAYLARQYGWPLSEHNIAVSNGSQSAFFILFNMFAGNMPDGSNRSIHLPLTPEYLGYADCGLSDEFFSATRPEIEWLEEDLFKYRVDFSRLNLDRQAGALCVSRPTNPTGNVLTDEEVNHLDELAKQREIPLIIDGAYGLPFPNILFARATPVWNENTILVLSLSKLGLPGVRTGIVIAREDIIAAYANANGIVNLACGNIGVSIATDLFRRDRMAELTGSLITPFYHQRAQQAVGAFRNAFGDVPFRIHKPEGAFFLWLWFEGLPLSCQELYERLKKRGVLVVPGHHCFFGLKEDWPHRHECIRVSYVQDQEKVRQGVAIIAEEVEKAYRGG